MDNLGLEDEYREFKESTVELDKGLISLSAMLNKNGHGTVFFGVRDNGDVIGQDIGKMTLKSITQAINNQIDPPIIASLEVCESSQGKKYISVSASGTDRPYACRNGIYVRTGEEDRKVPMSELRRMFMTSGDNLIHTTSNNKDLTFGELCSVLEKNGMHVSDTESMHRSLDLLNIEGRYNIQAQLLSDQNPAILTVAVFKGRDRTFMSVRKEFSGHSLLIEVRDSLDYVLSLNDTFVVIGSRGREEKSLFDESAFKEAWINACVHNYWVGVIPPTVHVFDDRMEVISYGDKPYWLSAEDFYSGCSMPVNESLMRIFTSARLSEHTGNGMPVIVEACGRDSVSCSSSGVIITIPFHRERVASPLGTGRTPISDKEKLVLEAMYLHPRETLDGIAEMTGVSRSYVGKIVVRLQDLGLVSREGSKKNGTWVVR